MLLVRGLVGEIWWPRANRHIQFGVCLFTSKIQCSLFPIPQKQKKCLKKIGIANETLIELSDNFIFLEKIEDNGKVGRKKVAGISLLEKKIKEFSSLAETKKIEVKLFSKEKEVFVWAEENFLGIIFDNFLSNALRYSFEKSRISVRIKKESGRLIFLFENVGLRIKAEEMKCLFEKFYRSDSAKEFSPQGSGLGLYISKVLTDKMEGKIGVLNQGKKTIFWVSFPEFIDLKINF